MNRSRVLCTAGGAASIAAFALVFNTNSREAEASAPLPPATRAELQVAASRTAPTSPGLAARGRLWEPAAGSVRDARRESIPVERRAFEALRSAAPGERVTLRLSDRIPALAADVTHSSEHADGTRVTHARVDGDPEGQLIVQENEPAGFFLAQLYYPGEPIAYEFRPSGDGLVAERHLVSDLVCSMVGDAGAKVEMGLPEIAEAPGGNGKGEKGPGGGKGGAAPEISIGDASATEDSGSIAMVLTLSSKDRKNEIRVDYSTSNGSAAAPGDYVSSSGTAVFARNTNRTTIQIPIHDDSQLESDETFRVNLANPSGATIADGVGIATIVNDDAAPSISVQGGSASEGNSGTSGLGFSVRLGTAAGGTVTVDYATRDGSAVSGSDYQAVSGTLTFAPGELLKSVQVPVVGDTEVEEDEQFSLVLSNAVGAPISVGEATGEILNDDAAPSNVPLRSSLPGAAAVAYLDMDGETVSGTVWNGGNTIAAGGIDGRFSDAAMIDVWERVAEDYAPFQINVTTDESEYLRADPSRRIRCIITPTNEWYGSSGGVAYVGSFTWTGDTPCWVFSDNLANSSRYIAEAVSHEIGHTLGLRHDGRTEPSESYYQGHGSGETSWAPIMGVGYYKKLVQWSKGEYLNANNTEDDLAIITGQNGFGYRSDDHGDSAGGSTPLAFDGTNLSGSGRIESDADVDVFAFVVSTAGTVSLAIDGASSSSDLDVRAELRDASGAVLASANPADRLDADLVATLAAGTYYLHVQGVGKGDPKGDGYSGYASLGGYTVTGQLY